jgi:hypothetical protein
MRRSDYGSEYFTGGTYIESTIFCEKCVNLENQLHSVQEELNSAKLVIKLLLKDIGSLEGNQEKREKNLYSDIRNDKCIIQILETQTMCKTKRIEGTFRTAVLE